MNGEIRLQRRTRRAHLQRSAPADAFEKSTGQRIKWLTMSVEESLCNVCTLAARALSRAPPVSYQ